MFFDLCPWGTIGLIVDICFVLIGIIVALVVTKMAAKKGWVGEWYCIALLAAIVFTTYALASYDVSKLKCNCDAPLSKSEKLQS